MDLHLENLTKRFGKKLAVEIPSLTIRSGEFFTFVGPSGCGKTTTLNILAGLELPTAGIIRLGDTVLNDLPPHRRDVAFVFQTYALYPHRTVFGNLAFPLELARMPRKQVRERVEQVADLLGLTPLLDKRPAQLSGGERQRVALGRAIVRQPRLFLFDEPLSNLDAPLRAHMRQELKRIHQQLGTTFIYVTHDQEEALSLSDRVAVMQMGHVAQLGAPGEIYDAPANRFVASFFGSPAMNLFEAELLPRGDVPRVRVAGQEFRLPGLDPAAAVEGKVTVGIRPEHLRLSRKPAAGSWLGKITLTEAHGSQTYLTLEVSGLQLITVEPGQAAYQAGQQVWVAMPPRQVHIFHPQTDASIALWRGMPS